MARETLFDGRYRYDHIYPRGRSGEALRAYDTQDNDRPVVIKRPASQDAPPIRAGQEVNIRTERRALAQLAGHPVLTELLGEGTFRVGGQSHLYIVMERATGAIIEEAVLALAEAQQRLPELEMLVIVDALLDLLAAAHAREIVYNDVDAKHLFWDRDAYRLKVIDWGNAVFLEGDEITPQGISRQTDVFQVGELLYFIVTGGQRLLPQGERVDFGADAGRLPTRLQSIITRAVHPALEQRYPTLDALRADLADYRAPLERDRDAVLERVSGRLRGDRSQAELERLLDDVRAAQEKDPGHPATRALIQRIEETLHRLSVHADLDAARIYLESANWPRAAALLQQVINSAAGAERARALVLLETVNALVENDIQPPPAGLLPAVNALFEGDPANAARLLLVTPEDRSEARDQQWLLAARIQAQMSGVMVLRPHLLRLARGLESLSGQYRVRKANRLLDDAHAALAAAERGRLGAVIDGYRAVIAAMDDLAEFLESLDRGRAAERVAPLLDAANRAGDAAAAIAESLEITSQRATVHPGEARAALNRAGSLDPVNPVFAEINAMLDGLYKLLTRLGEYRPLGDGADLDEWFAQTAADLAPYQADLVDLRLRRLVNDTGDAGRAWAAFQQHTIEGSRSGAQEALLHAANAVRALNPALANWFETVAGVIGKARYVQRHALNKRFARLMADGWTAWDRGSGIEAERLGRQALEEVGSAAEQDAIDRLVRLGRLLRNWHEGHGEGDPALTEAIDAQVVALFTESEQRYWNLFTEQMPSPEAYLNAMGAGLVQRFEATSTAAQRILFFHYILRGVMEMYEMRPEDAEFWRAAAAQTLPNAENHVAYLALTNVMRDRVSIVELAREIDTITRPDEVRPMLATLQASPLYLLFRPVVESLQKLAAAFAPWAEGDFRAAGESIGEALEKLGDGERLLHISLPGCRAWLQKLYDTAIDLAITRGRIVETAEKQEEQPAYSLPVWHQRIVEGTEDVLGEPYSGRFKAWRDMYDTMLEIYTDPEKRRSRKLHDFDEMFHTAGINTHPVYPLYRFWRETVEKQPEFPAPPTDQPVPQFAQEAAAGGKPARTRPRLRLTRGRLRILGGAAALLVIGTAALLLLSAANAPPTIAVTITATPSNGAPTSAQIAAAGTDSGQTAAPPPETSAPSATPAPTNTRAPAVQRTPLGPEEATAASPATAAAPATAASPATAVSPATAASPATAVSPATAAAPATAVPASTTPTLSAEQIAGTISAIQTETAAAIITATPPPGSTATPTRIVVTIVQGFNGLAEGRQDVLAAMTQYVTAYPWPESWFGPDDAADGWALGLAAAQPSESLLQITLPADMLNLMFGPDAAVRLRRVEATFTLRSFDPALIGEGRIYFGLGLQGVNESSVALQGQLAAPNALNVGARVGGEFRTRTQYPLTDMRATIAIERNDSGEVDLFFNGDPIGPSRFLTAPNAPVVPYLFVQQGGLVVGITDFVAVLE